MSVPRFLIPKKLLLGGTPHAVTALALLAGSGEAGSFGGFVGVRWELAASGVLSPAGCSAFTRTHLLRRSTCGCGLTAAKSLLMVLFCFLYTETQDWKAKA